MQHVARLERQRADDLAHRRQLQRPAAAQWRRGKCEAGSVAAHAHEAHAALLHDDVLAVRLAARGQPGRATAQRGVAGKRQLAAGREDAHAVVGAGVGGRQQEGRLREICPAREGRHSRVVEALRVMHHGQRVALQGGGGEDIELVESMLRGHVLSSSFNTSASKATPRSIKSGATVTKLRRSVLARGAWAKKVAPGT